MDDSPAGLTSLDSVGELSRIALGARETPVHRLEATSGAAGIDVLVKNDGLYGRHGGNKGRKLEWILADVVRKRRGTILTAGALGTNHGLATALYGRELGIETVLILVDQPRDAHVERQLELLRGSGARLVFTHTLPRSVAALPWLMLRHAQLSPPRFPYFLPVGGSTPVGCLGYVRAGLELGRQVVEGGLPEPSHVVVAVGSGGTAAGLLVGMRLAGLGTRLAGIQVNDRTPLSARRIARLANRTVSRLRRGGVSVPDGLRFSAADLDLERRWLGAGYGHATEEGRLAIDLFARDGLALEPVYTAKAAAAMLALAREGAFAEGPVLYWHTYTALQSAPG